MSAGRNPKTEGKRVFRGLGVCSEGLFGVPPLGGRASEPAKAGTPNLFRSSDFPSLHLERLFEELGQVGQES
jgi:hypothetical protein